MSADLGQLEKKAKWIRRGVLESIARAKKGHIGGTYSCTDILTALYYGGGLKFDPKDANSPDRDAFILSKGHACLALYWIYRDLGWISEERLFQYGQDGASLGAQLDTSVPGVEYNTGSLGHALGICAGMALASKMDGRSNRAIALMGDAECDEGSVWEAIAFAGRLKINQLIGIIDRNRLSVTEVREDDQMFEGFTEKLRLFGWNSAHINGHSFPELLSALEQAKHSEKPFMIIAETVKGKGISFMENNIKWHHSLPTGEEFKKAWEELS